jgi:hypothetical protein
VASEESVDRSYLGPTQPDLASDPDPTHCQTPIGDQRVLHLGSGVMMGCTTMRKAVGVARGP